MKTCFCRPVTICAPLALAALSLGYWLGSRQPTRPPSSHLYPKSREDEGVKKEGRSLGQISQTGISGSPDDISPTLSSKSSLFEDWKLVLVVRTDLGMGNGKIAAQCSHATLACYKALQATNPAMLKQWERSGQTKIALRCENEEELLLLEATARSLNLCARSIQDAGRTQIAAGSRTVVGIGPGPARLVNQVTGKLRLL